VTPEQKRRRVSFSRKKGSSTNDLPQSEVAAAAAAAQASSETSSANGDPQSSLPKSSSKNTVFVNGPPPARTHSSAGSALRDAKKTLQDRDRQLNRVSLRSREMNDSAANFANAAQGFLELSQKKKK